MSDCGPETSVIDWVIEHSESLSLFQEPGVDYYCGDRSLEFAGSEQFAATAMRTPTCNHTL